MASGHGPDEGREPFRPTLIQSLAAEPAAYRFYCLIGVLAPKALEADLRL
jgi:hypothetical protein